MEIIENEYNTLRNPGTCKGQLILLGVVLKNLSLLFAFCRLDIDFSGGECNGINGFIFQEAMKQITQLLPEDLKKELYELWEVSIHTGLAFYLL